jgi:hypothetical protein
MPSAIHSPERYSVMPAAEFGDGAIEALPVA